MLRIPSAPPAWHLDLEVAHGRHHLLCLLEVLGICGTEHAGVEHPLHRTVAAHQVRSLLGADPGQAWKAVRWIATQDRKVPVSAPGDRVPPRHSGRQSSSVVTATCRGLRSLIKVAMRSRKPRTALISVPSGARLVWGTP